MTGTLSVCSRIAYALFDPDYINSYISPCFAKKLGRDFISLHYFFMVSTPLKKFLLVDLIVLDMVDFDVILKMD